MAALVQSPRFSALRTLRRFWPIGVVAPPVVGVLANDDWRSQVSVRLGGVARCTVSFATVSLIAVDYKFSLRGLTRGTPEYNTTIGRVHQRCADRVLRLCNLNRGVYTKAGQHVASMNQAAPKEYTTTLAVLQEHAPHQDYSQVCLTFMKEFGKLPTEVFAQFESEPIAAASIAQVHTAVTHDGRKTAVKVQYPNLQQKFETDLWAMGVMANALQWFFADLQLRWMVEEVRENIVQELDFVREGRNGERMASCFADWKNVKIPSIYWDLTTERILTMEFVPGIKVTDVAGMARAGINPAQVSALVCDVFSEMIFCHGFLHCDPHPGNLMVLKDPKTNLTSLVVLDHGLYRELEPAFRRDFCLLWKAMITVDSTLLAEVSTRLGAGKYAFIFPLIFTYRSMSGSTPLGGGLSKEERTAVRESLKDTTMASFMAFLENVPRDMLLVMKTMNFVRSINQELGGRSLDRFKAFVRYALQGIYFYRNGAFAVRWSDTFAWVVDAVSINSKLLLGELALWVAQRRGTANTHWTGR